MSATGQGSRGPEGPVFVIGLFRSGTSLLFSLLNQHAQIALMYECDVWAFPEALFHKRFNGPWLERLEFCNRTLSRHRLIFGGGLAGLETLRTPDDLYRTFSEGKGAVIWGEKSPLYCARLRLLARLYPRGSFILLWRDPVEVYRSLVHAGRKARYFRRRGMLSRLIFYQEQMIRQAAELHREGIRLHHVTYGDLIDHTEAVCRGICGFLGIEFDPKMPDLSRADLSAVYEAPHHDFLRRRIIERRQFSEEVLSPRVLQKLERFRARWSRLQRESLHLPGPAEAEAAASEPFRMERTYHAMAGSLLSKLDNAKRALIEFLPLPWLRTYRLLKKWSLRPRIAPANRLPLGKQFAAHWITLLTSGLLLAGIAIVDFLNGDAVTLAPFYLIPCSILTIVVNRRWGTLAAMVSAVIWSTLQNLDHPVRLKITVWNSIMRFILLEIVVRLLDRLHTQIAPSGGNSAE